METQFRAVLAAADSITSLLATPTSIYPVTLPTDAALPAIEYKVVGGSGKPSFNTRGIFRARMEVNCWGDTYDDAVTLRTAVIQALDGYADGTLSILFLQPQDFFDHDLLQYRALAEFYVWYAL